MTNYSIENLADNPSWIREAADWFSGKWNIPAEAYIESMEESCSVGEAFVPQWFVIRENSGSTAPIIAGYGIIANDFHDRPDLTPNLCALYVEDDYRGRGIATRLLNHARAKVRASGIDSLYLVTDLVGFYEKCGWEYLFDVKESDGNPIRMYRAKGLVDGVNELCVDIPSSSLSGCECNPIVIQEVNVSLNQVLMQELTSLWRASVEATHTFLAPDDIDRIAGYVPQAIEGVEHLMVARDDHEVLLGFIGTAEETVEMLFLDPAARGQGVGAGLLKQAIDTYGVDKVDVNEQNDQARGFYEHVGFEVIARSETDGMGDPFPILHMQLVQDGERYRTWRSKD